jgi:hypothetical protein
MAVMAGVVVGEVGRCIVVVAVIVVVVVVVI